MTLLSEYGAALLAFYLEIAPLLLLGLAVAGVLHLAFPEYLIERHLGGRGVGSVVKATLFGIPIPLCSCSVIPVMSSLKHKGASSGATISFLVGAPQIGADSWLLTYGLLGPLFATFRIGAALLTALVAGLVENLLPESRQSGATPEADRTTVIPPGDGSLRDRAGRLYSYLTHELLGSIAGSLVVGMLLAALITVLVPDSLLAGLGSHYPWLSMLLMLAISVPLYVCATASTPIAAALLFKGVSPGAALVFLLAGPATNAVTLATVHRTLGRRPTVIYLLTIALVAIGAGLLLDGLFLGEVRRQGATLHHDMHPGWFEWLSALVLGLLLARHFLGRWWPRRNTATARGASPDQGLDLQVGGMTCNHCVRRLEDSLRAVLPTSAIAIDLASGRVHLDGREDWNGEPGQRARAAVIQAGFVLEEQRP